MDRAEYIFEKVAASAGKTLEYVAAMLERQAKNAKELENLNTAFKANGLEELVSGGVISDAHKTFARDMYFNKVNDNAYKMKKELLDGGDNSLRAFQAIADVANTRARNSEILKSPVGRFNVTHTPTATVAPTATPEQIAEAVKEISERPVGPSLFSEIDRKLIDAAATQGRKERADKRLKELASVDKYLGKIDAAANTNVLSTNKIIKDYSARVSAASDAKSLEKAKKGFVDDLNKFETKNEVKPKFIEDELRAVVNSQNRMRKSTYVNPKVEASVGGEKPLIEELKKNKDKALDWIKENPFKASLAAGGTGLGGYFLLRD